MLESLWLAYRSITHLWTVKVEFISINNTILIAVIVILSETERTKHSPDDDEFHCQRQVSHDGLKHWVFSDRLTFVARCPATNPMHQQRAALPERVHLSFQLDRTGCSNKLRTRRLLASCAIGRNIHWLTVSLSRVFGQFNPLDSRLQFNGKRNKFSRSHDFSPFAQRVGHPNHNPNPNIQPSSTQPATTILATVRLHSLLGLYNKKPPNLFLVRVPCHRPIEAAQSWSGKWVQAKPHTLGNFKWRQNKSSSTPASGNTRKEEGQD